MDIKAPDKKITDKNTERNDSDNFKQAFPQGPVLKGNEKQKNKVLNENDEKEFILFYKAPIFKYSKYDFY